MFGKIAFLLISKIASKFFIDRVWLIGCNTPNHKEKIMTEKKTKKHRIKGTCPQCGCSHLSTMTEEEIKEKYPDVENATMECSECLATMELDFEETD